MTGKRSFFTGRRRATGVAAFAAGLALLALVAAPLLQREHLAGECPAHRTRHHCADAHVPAGLIQFVPSAVTHRAATVTASGHDAHRCPLCQFFFSLSKACPLLLALLAVLALKAVLLGEAALPARLYPVRSRRWQSRAPPVAAFCNPDFCGTSTAALRAVG